LEAPSVSTVNLNGISTPSWIDALDGAPQQVGRRENLGRRKDGLAVWSGGGKLGQMDLGGKGGSAHWGNTFQKQLQGIN